LSGIAGIFHRDGAPVATSALQACADALAFRGPNAQEIWSDGNIGFAHAMLRESCESQRERQPASLDNRFYITADVRLDARAELFASLQSQGRSFSPAAPDSEFILHSYAAWGAQCVDHLRGDFAFAIWDSTQKTLFCARDHFGIRPFYLALLGQLFFFSNTLDCLRLHQAVSGELNDAAVGDFLLFGLNCDNATTIFRDIQRLLPAHSLTISSSDFRLHRYWTPPTDGRIRYSRPEDYVEHFRAIIQSAVADRLRTDCTGILLSGGLDSGSVAAVAKESSTNPAAPSDLHSFTFLFDSQIADPEGDFARQTSEFLHIPHHALSFRSPKPFDRWDDPAFHTPEPMDDPLFTIVLDSYRNISTHCRVLLSGEGADNLMEFQMWPYLADLRRTHEWRRMFRDVSAYLSRRRFPWLGIYRRLQGVLGLNPETPVFPKWLSPEFSQRALLEDRWREWNAASLPGMNHPIHPLGHASLSIPHWTRFFDLENPGFTRSPVQVNYPFLDLRMVNFLLSIPPFPWFFKKDLLRRAMRGHLPEAVRTRPKTPQQSDPFLECIRASDGNFTENFGWSGELDRYINSSLLSPLRGNMNSEQASQNARPHCLNIWLQSARRIGYKLTAETLNG
jgi:asparagine synthase (glutamine-hydrolysing)